MLFELKQSLNLKLQQQLVMTPQLQQAIRLLQLSRLELIEEIRKECDANPVLADEEFEPRPRSNTDANGAEILGTPPEQGELRIDRLEDRKRLETGATETVFGAPQHPYTQRLLGAFPEIGGERTLPPAIPGAPPDPAEPPSGCRFHPRCHLAREVCTHGDLHLHPVGEEHESACLFAPFTPAPVGGALP